MLNKVSKFIKDKKYNEENILVIKGQSEDDFSGFSPAPEIPEQRTANILEDAVLKLKKVIIKCEKSGFTHFLDGIERKKVILNYNFIPVTYGYVAAVIMGRTDKKMRSTGLEDVSEKIYLPYKKEKNGDEPENYFNYEDVADLLPENTGTPNDDGTYPRFPKEFEKRAHNDIQTTRVQQEKALAKKWLNEDFDGWLYIDGRLENKNNEMASNPRVAGIIKSHHVYYFSPNEQNKIYMLKKGERTSVFQPIDKNNKEENIYSWYLRLHDNNHNGGLDFGIIRVEIPAKEELLNQVDIISQWILLERNPVAFPASRWDRMIYPIKYCEDYLKSKAPSWTKLESL